MGYFLSWFSLSKSATSTALDVSDIVLLVSGALLLFGALGEYLEDHKRLPRWMRWPKLIFEIIVAVSLAGELIADGGVFVFSHHLQKLEGADIDALERKSAKALDDSNAAIGEAKAASDEAAAAKLESSNAKGIANASDRLARGTRKEADSFEGDIVSAKTQAADAESHLAEALRSAVEAKTELDRLKSPRSLTDMPGLLSALGRFRGTSYTFTEVFADEDSAHLLRLIDEVLQEVGWNRVITPAIGTPALTVAGSGDFTLTVLTTIASGVRVVIEFPDGYEALRSLPADKEPMYARAAEVLDVALFASISPPEDIKRPPLVNVFKGRAEVVRISVGKKP
jgi:hypothetical protein